MFGPNKSLPQEIDKGIINGIFPETEISSPVKQNIAIKQQQMISTKLYNKKRNKSMNGMEAAAIKAAEITEQ